jgi:hypothetical protein
LVSNCIIPYANLAPPLVTYPSLHTKHEKHQKGDIKLERIFSCGAVPGYSRPCLQSS